MPLGKTKTPASAAEARRRPRLRSLAAGLTGLLLAWAAPAAQAEEVSDLVSRASLRVCADPSDLPMSDREGRGFENRVAELLARELGLPLEYVWYPQATGWYRNTLGARRCDVAMNIVGGADPVQNTNHYYRSAWVLLYRQDDERLAGVGRLEDERLRDKRVGVIAGTPPATHLGRLGMMPRAKSYRLMIDRRHDSPVEDMIRDVAAGTIDAGILWGPPAGYYLRESGAPLVLVPLVDESRGPPLAYRMTFGIRPGEVNWRRQLNSFIRSHQEELHAILRDFGVPLLDERNRPLDNGTR